MAETEAGTEHASQLSHVIRAKEIGSGPLSANTLTATCFKFISALKYRRFDTLQLLCSSTIKYEYDWNLYELMYTDSLFLHGPSESFTQIFSGHVHFYYSEMKILNAFPLWISLGAQATVYWPREGALGRSADSHNGMVAAALGNIHSVPQSPAPESRA